MKLFRDTNEWAVWLRKKHDTSPGVWLRISKVESDVASVSYAEGLEEALCYGWIDGQEKRYDDDSWLQKFSPRGDRSIWSRINQEKAQKLIRSGKITPAWLTAVECAKKNGRWVTAYDSPGRARVPTDLDAALTKYPKAKGFFATLNGQNRYTILFRIQTAKKAETRQKKIQQFVRMLERGETLYLQKAGGK